MDAELGLAPASREALVAVIARLKDTNAQLQQRIAASEAQLNTRDSRRVSGIRARYSWIPLQILPIPIQRLRHNLAEGWLCVDFVVAVGF